MLTNSIFSYSVNESLDFTPMKKGNIITRIYVGKANIKVCKEIIILKLWKWEMDQAYVIIFSTLNITLITHGTFLLKYNYL